MGNERTQPTSIDAEEYERFRQFVQDVHGSLRGNLSTEIENALREYRTSYYGEDRLLKIEEDLATVKQLVAEAESDGGTAAPVADDATPTPSEAESTRAHRTERPAPNQPRRAKIDYLLTTLLADVPMTRDYGMTTRPQIRQVIESEYNFAEDTTTSYVETIIDRLDAKPHPEKDHVVAWGERYDEMIDALRQDAAGELHEITDASEVENAE
jgi:hypothetical protein